MICKRHEKQIRTPQRPSHTVKPTREKQTVAYPLRVESRRMVVYCCCSAKEDIKKEEDDIKR